MNHFLFKASSLKKIEKPDSSGSGSESDVAQSSPDVPAKELSTSNELPPTSSNSESESTASDKVKSATKSADDCFGIAARNRYKIDFLKKKDIKLRNGGRVVISFMDKNVADQVFYFWMHSDGHIYYQWHNIKVQLFQNSTKIVFF